MPRRSRAPPAPPGGGEVRGARDQPFGSGTRFAVCVVHRKSPFGCAAARPDPPRTNLPAGATPRMPTPGSSSAPILFGPDPVRVLKESSTPVPQHVVRAYPGPRVGCKGRFDRTCALTAGPGHERGGGRLGASPKPGSGASRMSWPVSGQYAVGSARDVPGLRPMRRRVAAGCVTRQRWSAFRFRGHCCAAVPDAPAPPDSLPTTVGTPRRRPTGGPQLVLRCCL